jgi:cyclopropane-fatty-acyl-phospholipid synthase
MDWLLRFLLKTFIRRGAFRLTTSRGTQIVFGDGTGKPVAVRFATRAAEWSVVLDPELRLGEAYMNGSFVVEHGSIADVLAVVLGQNRPGIPKWAKLQWYLRYYYRRLQQFNPRRRSKRNVARHYDLNGLLYSLFLDTDWQYSCAYFEHPGQSLDDAQLAKKRHLAAKLLLKPAQRVLDIGCGWGGLGLYLAEMTDAQVTGITLSQEQLAVANLRASEKGLSDHATFMLQDYRDVEGKFDRIVSVGMFEHVGVSFYDTFFRKCASLLTHDGVMLLHSIGRSAGPDATSPWIAKYIFPGGYIPALSEVMPAIQRSGLLVTDNEVWHMHYAETLKHWRERLLAHRADVERIYDQQFVRMWEFYLACSEMAFRGQALMVFQIQLTKRPDIVPMTRDYIERAENQLRAAEVGRHPQMRRAAE